MIRVPGWSQPTRYRPPVGLENWRPPAWEPIERQSLLAVEEMCRRGILRTGRELLEERRWDWSRLPSPYPDGAEE